MIDTAPFYTDAQPHATEAGIAGLAEAHTATLQAKTQAEAALAEAEDVVRKLQVTERDLGFHQRALREEIYNLDSADLDAFVSNPDLAKYRDQANARQQRRAELDWAVAAGERIRCPHIPAASLKVLRAREVLAAAKVAVAESAAITLIARKLFLLGPILELEGDTLRTEGGLSDAAIRSVFEAREEHAKTAEVLVSATQLFEQSQKQRQ